MAEFATGPTGHNEHWGDCHNPWNPDHISGWVVERLRCSGRREDCIRSSRLGHRRLGSPARGLLRVVGLKPSEGLISRYGIMALSQTMDTVGPLCRTVRDAARHDAG